MYACLRQRHWALVLVPGSADDVQIIEELLQRVTLRPGRYPDCCQTCCQDHSHLLTQKDRHGTSAQQKATAGRSWTDRPLLRIRWSISADRGPLPLGENYLYLSQGRGASRRHARSRRAAALGADPPRPAGQWTKARRTSQAPLPTAEPPALMSGSLIVPLVKLSPLIGRPRTSCLRRGKPCPKPSAARIPKKTQELGTATTTRRRCPHSAPWHRHALACRRRCGRTRHRHALACRRRCALACRRRCGRTRHRHALACRRRCGRTRHRHALACRRRCGRTRHRHALACRRRCGRTRHRHALACRRRCGRTRHRHALACRRCCALACRRRCGRTRHRHALASRRRCALASRRRCALASRRRCGRTRHRYALASRRRCGRTRHRHAFGFRLFGGCACGHRFASSLTCIKP